MRGLWMVVCLDTLVVDCLLTNLATQASHPHAARASASTAIPRLAGVTLVSASRCASRCTSRGTSGCTSTDDALAADCLLPDWATIASDPLTARATALTINHRLAGLAISRSDRYWALHGVWLDNRGASASASTSASTSTTGDTLAVDCLLTDWATIASYPLAACASALPVDHRLAGAAALSVRESWLLPLPLWSWSRCGTRLSDASRRVIIIDSSDSSIVVIVPN